MGRHRGERYIASRGDRRQRLAVLGVAMLLILLPAAVSAPATAVAGWPVNTSCAAAAGVMLNGLLVACVSAPDVATSV